MFVIVILYLILCIWCLALFVLLLRLTGCDLVACFTGVCLMFWFSLLVDLCCSVRF